METEAVAVPAPVTIAPPEKPSVDITMSDKQRDKWLLTGKEPKDQVSEPPEPKKAEKETATEAEAAAEPGTEAKPEQEQSPSKMGYGALRAHIKKLEAELAASKTAPKAEAARVEEPKAKAEKLRAKPTSEDKKEDGTPKYQTWEEFNEDLIDWKAEEKLTAWVKNQEKAKKDAEIESQVNAVKKTWEDRSSKFRETHPQFEEALDPINGPASLIKPGSVVDRWILLRAEGPALLNHFHGNREDLKRIQSLEELDQAAELALLGKTLSGEPKAPPAEEASKPEPKVTKAPPPAREVGGRGTTATDPLRKALEDDDFTAYQAAANRKAIAASK